MRLSMLALVAWLAPAVSLAQDAPSTDWLTWHWVYQGVAHAQPFDATGTEVKGVMLRVARLTDTLPAAPLIVEVRDRSLSRVFASGSIDPKVTDLTFRWVPVVMDAEKTQLSRGHGYYLVFRSAGSANTAPWIICAQDGAAGKKQLATTDVKNRQFASIVLFKDSPEVHFGPPLEAPASTPKDSGTVGASVYMQSLVVELKKPLPNKDR
jgi:hypothetical protein